ncbi:hypothetical protein L1987_79185 [Smallanthus sonchifolius]|uniref:Uncharacterized protein n=1 Tax=Smallanthus sonchifolius TaxID=185202 RepID=A0ACB8ZJ74_9ASTR|nr:hypothetical protein L1987_79185 [Smallanthus sonchifolius]
MYKFVKGHKVDHYAQPKATQISQSFLYYRTLPSDIVEPNTILLLDEVQPSTMSHCWWVTFEILSAKSNDIFILR